MGGQEKSDGYGQEKDDKGGQEMGIGSAASLSLTTHGGILHSPQH